MEHQKIIDYIVQWLKTYSEKSSIDGFVVGVSGGIDSAVTSTLCALTGKKVMAVSMPILQPKDQLSRSYEHTNWLNAQFSNVSNMEIDLTKLFEASIESYPNEIQDELTMANVRARLRMTTLYAIAGHNGFLVAGTGNKVEDFGVGFYTKYGDGGVDLSPIADLMKSEVFQLGAHLNIVESILNAKPTDGLWGDDRTDEDQLGATYAELEWAMNHVESNSIGSLSEREKEVLGIYQKLHRSNQHKMIPIPVCEIPSEYK